LDSLEEKYSDKTDYENKLEIISNILPYYSDIYKDDKINLLSDYKFINYVESIVETFNISFDNSL
jgi:hypothetical protein